MCCGHAAKAGGTCAQNLSTLMTTHMYQGTMESLLLIWDLWGEQGKPLKPFQNSWRGQAKETGLGAYCDWGWGWCEGSRVQSGTCVARIFHWHRKSENSGFLTNLSRCGTQGDEEGVRVKADGSHNIKIWGWTLQCVMSVCVWLSSTTVKCKFSSIYWQVTLTFVKRHC